MPALSFLSDLFEKDSSAKKSNRCSDTKCSDSIKPENILAFNLDLSRLYYEISETETSLEFLDKALVTDPLNQDAMQRRTLLLRELGRPEEALGAAKDRLGTQTDPSERASSLALVAQLEIDMGNKKRAFEALHEAVTLTGPIGEAAEMYQAHSQAQNAWVNYAASLADHVKASSLRRSSICRRARSYSCLSGHWLMCIPRRHGATSQGN